MASHSSSSASVPADDLLIADQGSFDRLIPRLTAWLLAVDTEAASFHKYLDRVYLLQLSSRDETAVVDPLAVKDLSAFGAMLADPAIEVVFHDADYDLRLLHQEFGFQATHLFDTRVAAQLLDEPGFGLAALLEKYLGMRIDKRFQRADWSLRPLSDEMLAYAATDTRHLAELRDILRSRLVELGRLAWAEEEFVVMEGIALGQPRTPSRAGSGSRAPGSSSHANSPSCGRCTCGAMNRPASWTARPSGS